MKEFELENYINLHLELKNEHILVGDILKGKVVMEVKTQIKINKLTLSLIHENNIKSFDNLSSQRELEKSSTNRNREIQKNEEILEEKLIKIFYLTTSDKTFKEGIYTFPFMLNTKNLNIKYPHINTFLNLKEIHPKTTKENLLSLMSLYYLKLESFTENKKIKEATIPFFPFQRPFTQKYKKIEYKLFNWSLFFNYKQLIVESEIEKMDFKPSEIIKIHLKSNLRPDKLKIELVRYFVLKEKIYKKVVETKCFFNEIINKIEMKIPPTVNSNFVFCDDLSVIFFLEFKFLIQGKEVFFRMGINLIEKEKCASIEKINFSKIYLEIFYPTLYF